MAAARSVGRIEVTVEADTGRLQASIVKGAVKGSARARKLAKEELSGIEATIDLQDKLAKQQAKLLREEIEAVLRGIEVSTEVRTDINQARAELIEFREIEEAKKLLLAIALDETSMAAASAKVSGFTEKQREIIFGSELDTTELNAELAKIDAAAHTIELLAELDDAFAEARLEKLAAERREVQIQAILDDDQFQRDIVQRMREAKQRYRVEIGMVADFSELNEDLRTQRIATEAERWDITTRAQTGTFQAEIDRIRWEEEAEFIELRLKLAKAAAQAEIDEFEAFVEARDIAADLALETAKASAEMTSWIAEQQRKKVDVPLDPDLLAATAEFDAWLEVQQRKGIDVNVDPDTVRATIAFEAWIARMQQQRINVDVDVDEEGFFAALQALQTAGVGGGGGGGDLLGGLDRTWALVIEGIIAAGDSLAAGLEGALAAAVSVTSSAFSALAGAAGAIVPILAGIANTAGGVIVGMQGMGDALGAVNKEFKTAAKEGRAFSIDAEAIRLAMAGLAPEAQETVRAFAELRPIFDDVRREVQGKLFEGMADQLRLLSVNLLPDLSDALSDGAESANKFFKELTDAASDVDFSAIADAVQPVIDDLGKAFIDVFRAIEPFIQAAAPAAQQLADSFQEAALHLREMIEQGQESGALNEFLTEGIESLKIWWDLLRNVGDALFTLFQAGKDSGDTFVQSLSNMVQRWDEFMESVEGQRALEEFFDRGREVMEALKPLLAGLKEGFKNMVSGDAVGQFRTLTTQLGQALEAIGALISEVGKLNILPSAIELITIALRGLTAILDVIPDGLKPMIGAFVVVAKVMGPLPRMFLGLVSSIKTLVRAFDLMTSFIGGPATIALTGIGIALGAVTAAFLASGQQAAKAKAEVEEYVEALTQIEGGASSAIAVQAIMENLRDENTETRESFLDLGFIVSDWAQGIVSGTQSAESGMAELLRTAGPAGEAIAAALEQGKLTADDVATAFENHSDRIISSVDGQVYGINKLREDYGALGVSSTELGNMFDFLRDEGEEFGLGQEEIARRARESGKALQESGDAAFGFQNNMNLAAEATAHFLGPLAPGTKQLAGFEANTTLAAEAAAYFAGYAEDMTVSAEELGGSLSDIPIEDVHEAFQNIVDPVSAANDAIRDAAEAAEDAATEADTLRESWDLLFDAASRAQEASDAFQKSLIAVQERVEERAQAERDLAEAKQSAAEDEVAAADKVAEAQAKLNEVNADADATDADRIKAQNDLRDAQNDLSKAQSDGAQAVADANKKLQETTLTLQGNSAAALENRDLLRDMKDAAIEDAGAQLERGKSVEFVRDRLLQHREEMIQQAMEFGKTRKQAERYVNQLGLTPKNIDTLVRTPGMNEAQTAADDLNATFTTLDGMVVSVDTKAEGIEAIQAGLDGILGTGDDISRKAATFLVKTEGVPQTQQQLQDMITRADELFAVFTNLDGKEVVVKTEVDGVKAVMAGLDGIAGTADDISRKTARQVVETEGVPKTQDELQSIIDKANALDGKHATVTVDTNFNFKQEGSAAAFFQNLPGNQFGGQVGPYGGIGGEAGAELVRWGSLRGLISRPTLLPPGTMVTSAALTAALLRNQPVGKQVYNTINVMPNQADPEAVATSVLNRAAVLAH